MDPRFIVAKFGANLGSEFANFQKFSQNLSKMIFIFYDCI